MKLSSIQVEGLVPNHNILKVKSNPVNTVLKPTDVLKKLQLC